MRNMKNYFHSILFLFLLFGTSVMLISCHFFDRSTTQVPTSPAIETFLGFNSLYGDEDGERFRYERSETPGITITADFTTYHIEGQPWGTWVINATWRSAPRKVVCPGGDLGVEEPYGTYLSRGCAYIIMPVMIDESTGIGTAVIPSEFLDTVLEEAHSRYMATKENDWPDAEVWHHSPGLYLNFYPGEETWQYYAFE